jgi:hypothetical protein
VARGCPARKPGLRRQAARVTQSRSAMMWELAAGHAAAAGRRSPVAGVCAVAARSAQVSGAWVTASSDGGPDLMLCVTGPLQRRSAAAP